MAEGKSAEEVRVRVRVRVRMRARVRVRGALAVCLSFSPSNGPVHRVSVWVRNLSFQTIGYVLRFEP